MPGQAGARRKVHDEQEETDAGAGVLCWAGFQADASCFPRASDVGTRVSKCRRTLLKYRSLLLNCHPTSTPQASATGELGYSQITVSFPEVFFRAGILARLEDVRDECPTEIMTMLQHRLCSFLVRVQFKKMLERR